MPSHISQLAGDGELSVGLVGLRHMHSQGHLRTLDTLPEVGKIVVWDEDPSAYDEMRDEAPQTELVRAESFEELLADRGLAYVVAAHRNRDNPDVFCAILEADHHLLAEKPFGRNAEDARRVAAAAAKADRQLSVFYTNRFLPLIQQARDLVRSGALGELYSMEIRALTTQVRSRGPELWLFDQEQAGGGWLSWLGCHYLDLFHAIPGDEVASVSADIATRGYDAVDVEDIATVSLRMQSGALAHLHGGYVLGQSGGGFYDSGYDAYYAFNGRDGRLWWGTDEPDVLHVESTATEIAASPRRQYRYEGGDSPAYGGVAGEQFVRQFYAATLGQARVPVPAKAAIRVALITDAIYESARTGQRVAVLPPPTEA